MGTRTEIKIEEFDGQGFLGYSRIPLGQGKPEIGLAMANEKTLQLNSQASRPREITNKPGAVLPLTPDDKNMIPVPTYGNVVGWDKDDNTFYAYAVEVRV